jgi:hypothetical protein
LPGGEFLACSYEEGRNCKSALVFHGTVAAVTKLNPEAR